MLRFVKLRRTIVSLVAIVCVVAATLGVTLFQAHTNPANNYVALSNSYPALPAGAQLAGARTSSQPMTITLVMQSSQASQMNNLLANLYNPQSSSFHQWLKPGEFNARFAPSASQTAQVQNFLKNSGLSVGASPSPFLVRATGTTAQVNAALHTQINNYTVANKKFYQNNSLVQIPENLNGLVVAVAGLTNTSAPHPNYVRTAQAAKAQGKALPHYGAGPGGSGLTPSQTESLYDANPVYWMGSSGQGSNATLAVFELSGYTPSDITNWENQFFGPSENVPLTDINVDGGPITPACPSGDECGPFSAGPCANGCDSADYSGDIEVEADLENQIAIAPGISQILVYNAPNDATGTTTTDEYFKIANDDLADSISSSWGLCEQDNGLANIKAESVAFEQMAFQGQSVFSAAGDTGAYDCLRGSGYTGLTVDDPGSQPFVTSVGGTSFSTFDPGANQYPWYPSGKETVWNVKDSCNGTTAGLQGCANNGAGGGGVSSVWQMMPWQYGRGVINKYSKKSPYCSQAAKGQYCGEVPGVSANADEYTPYAEYCTGNPKTNSNCATFSSTMPAAGWFGIGGTSLSSPLWSAVIALWDSVNGTRFGTANFGLYELFNSPFSYDIYFHDITGKGQTINNNGYYPTTRGYDMATGIGTPRIAGLIYAGFFF